MAGYDSGSFRITVSLASGETAEIDLLPGCRVSDLKERLRRQWPSYKDVSLNLLLPGSSTLLSDTEPIQSTEPPLHLLAVAGEAAAPVRVDEIIAAINKSCQDAGGIYAGYSCKAISWDDCTRSTGVNGLSCTGPNITDSRLVERNGQTLFTVRGANWNERLGKISADDVTVLVGVDKEPQAISLRQYLHEIHQHGAYAGVPEGTSLQADADDAVSIRFQTSFLPVAEDGTVEFCGEAHNYQTLSNDDPKNLVLLCTSEGTALQQQGVGYQKLFLHEKKADEQIARRWLEAKSTGHKVGGAQEESWEAAVESAEAAAEAQRVLQEAKAKEDPGDEELERLKDKAAKLEVEANERRLRAAEAEEAAKEGKAVARRFGIDAMGSRCNMLMTIQVPLQQQEKPPPMPSGSGFAGEVCGIDFGTTNCRVALWKDGGVTVVPNAMGNFNTPCCVAAKDGELLVGEAAEAAKWDAVHTGPENFVAGPKRFLGRTWSELSAKQMCLAAPLKEGCNDRPCISLPCGPEGQQKLFDPEEMAGLVLRDVKKVVTNHLGNENKQLGCVLTVPAHATDAQRQATKSAAELAGFNVLRIINEPTAAAIAHGLSCSSDERKILVVNVGAGTTDVSLLLVEDGIFEILATNGAQLGGSDFDEALMGYINGSKEPRRERQLRNSCEAAKRKLSFCHEAEIDLDLPDEDASSCKISRALFENLIRPHVQEVQRLVELTLHDGNAEKTEIQDVLLVGGSAHVPKLREMLRELFGKEPCETPNAEHTVVQGAAYQAATLCGAGGSCLDLLLLDVTPLSIGFESANGAMTRVIERNTTIPTKRKVTLTTHADSQSSVKLRIFEGERSSCQDNHFLGDFAIDNLPPAPKGAPQVEVTFDIDANGILRVSAIEKSTGKSSMLTITNEKGSLSKEQIDEMIQAEDGQLQGTNELPGADSVQAYGTSYAARVSRGRVHDYWTGLTIQPRRDESQHCTITVQLYHTVAGGVPSPEDVKAAIDDLESLFRHCEWHGSLAESGANFMKAT